MQEIEGTKVCEIANKDTGEVVFAEQIINNEVIVKAIDEEEQITSPFINGGTYVMEISVYGTNSKLTSVSNVFTVNQEQVIIDDTVIAPQLPIFNRLMEEISNLDIDAEQTENKTTITITKKDGTTKVVEINNNSSSGGTNNYEELSNRQTIPTKTSDLTNDSGFITNSYHDNDKQDKIQYSTMPTVNLSNLGKIIQYIGETNNNYTNGYFYRCKDNSTQESITASQTDNGVTLGPITVDNTTLKSKVNSGTHEFVYRPYDTVLNFMNMNVFPPVSIQVTRDNTFDRQPMIPNAPKIYSWVDNSNNFYATDTLQPNALTKLYSLDIQTFDLTDTGATFISSNTPSQLEGRWTKKEGDIYTDVDINDYGIYLTSSGLPGNTIQVNYIEANTNYIWERVNMQPITNEISSNSTNNEIPTAKAIYDYIQSIISQ